LTISLAQAALTTTSVAWSTVDGTAKAGLDYVAASGTLRFASGATTAQVVVTVLGNNMWQASHAFQVAFSNAWNLTRGSPATVTILDDDPVPSLSIADASITEGNSGTKLVTLTVTLSNPTSAQVTVSYATAAGTATATSDFQSKSGTLTFAPGTTTQTITVTIVGDTLVEPNETFKVNLSSPVNATLAKSSGTVTILNDDGAPLMAASAPTTATTQMLTQSQLDAAVAQAKADWLAAEPTANLSGVTFSIGDLDGTMLGVTNPWRQITIDANAAGWGWSEMNLVTVVEHELGHVLGLEHDAGGVMAPTLAPDVTLHPTGTLITVGSAPSVAASPAVLSIGLGGIAGIHALVLTQISLSAPRLITSHRATRKLRH
jgi:Calx-beta domain/Matrixin